MEKDVIAGIMKEYEGHCPLYATFTESMKKLIEDLLKENDIHVHSVTCRTKAKDSLQTKLTQAERNYSKLDDVPDISGLRIITYFADDVDLVANMIEKEFVVDKTRSVNKRELLDPDRFGYVSLHYVVRLPASRLGLTEYRRFADCHAEIQIRSILQHAWAEIEHDLGYKSKYAVPKGIRRRFSRLAGLLEIADVEFSQIRDNLREYEGNVPKLIAEAPEKVLIDKASLLSLIETSSLVHELDKKIASSGKLEIGKFVSNIDNLLGELKYLGVNNIAELYALLQEEKETIAKFAELWLSAYWQGNVVNAGRGVCIFYLSYVLVGKKQAINEAYDYLDSFAIGDPDERKSDAENIVSFYSKAASG